MNLSEEQVISLAPDDASIKAGKDLANPAKWGKLEESELALWGECQGSGSKPYQTQIDRNSIAFKCSCPSRKFPCKHGIALGLLHARQPQLFSKQEMPAWVNEWISKRSEKEEKKLEKKEKPVDEAAQAKRQQAREQKVAAGTEELLLWIRDIVRNGFIAIPDKDYTYWEGMAKRMVDAQAPGLASAIRSLADINFYREGWQTPFLDKLLHLYLLARAYQNKEQIEAALLDDIRNLIGFTVNQEELRSQPGTQDQWLVAAKQVSEDDNLKVERCWLYGINSKRSALILQFMVRGADPSVLLSPGMFIDAELVYFPSLLPLRALIKSHNISRPAKVQYSFDGWKQVAEAEAEKASRFPLRSEDAYFIKEIHPVNYNGSWWLKDRSDDMVPIRENFPGLFKLLAIGGGMPLDTFVVGRENSYEPLGICYNQNYLPI